MSRCLAIIIAAASLLCGLSTPAAASVIYQFVEKTGSPAGFAPKLIVNDGVGSLNFSVQGPTSPPSCFVIGPPCTITGTYPDGFLSFTDSSVGIGTFTITGTLTTHFVGTIVDHGLNETLDLTCSSGTNCTFTLLSDHYPVCGVGHPCSGTGEFDVVISEPGALSIGITGLLALLLLAYWRRSAVPSSKAPPAHI
jgi:hypothetical protein